MTQSAMRGNSAHFLALRRRLDMMGYNDFPLGLDTAPLAQHMLDDLVATTEALRESDEDKSKLSQDLELCKSQIEPLQAENIKLTRENVQLHQQLVVATEETMRIDNQKSASAFELQAENRRLKLLNQKSSEHVKSLKSQIDTLTKRISEVTSAPSMMKIPETIECDPRKMRKTPRASRASSQISDNSSGSSTAFDPSVFNKELENLRNERDFARRESEEVKQQLSDLQGVIKLRDDEIDRLGSELQKKTGSNGFLDSLLHKCNVQESEIEKLRAQVRVVNPSAAPKVRRLVLTPPRVTITITDDEVYQPSTPSTSRAPSILSEPINVEIEEDEESILENKEVKKLDSDNDNEEEEEEEEPKPRKSKPIPVSSSTITPSEKKGFRVHFEMPEEKETVEVSDETVNELKAEAEQLKSQISKLENEITSKNHIIATHAANFAYINDHIDQIIANKDDFISELQQKLFEKSAIIQNLQSKLSQMDVSSINDTTKEIDQEREITEKEEKRIESINSKQINELKEELEKTKIQAKNELNEKSKQIDQLNALVQTLSNITPIQKECPECTKLKQQLTDLTIESQKTTQEAQEQIAIYKTRAEQLEVLVRASDDEKHQAALLDAELQQANKRLTNQTQELERLRTTVVDQQSQMDETTRALEDAQNQLKKLPNIEQRYSTIIAGMKSDQAGIEKELKQKSVAVGALSDRLRETQRVARELQAQLEKTREDAKEAREEAAFHRSKAEEIVKKTTDASIETTRDANAAIANMKKKLEEKHRESIIYQKQLSEARRELAPLLETKIPQYQHAIQKLKKERDILVQRIKQLCQLGVYVQNFGESPDNSAFTSGLHQVQEEMKSYFI